MTDDDPVFESALEELERTGAAAIRMPDGWTIALTRERLEELLVMAIEDDFAVLHVQRPPDA